jgi:hypothetical protein
MVIGERLIMLRTFRQIALRLRGSFPQNQNSLQGKLILGGLIIIAIGVFVGIRNGKSSEDHLVYKPEDVVYYSPLVAIHEINPPTISTIKFLPAGGPQPRIVVSESFHDFGNIQSSDIAEFEFVIANLGDAPLIINRAYTTCGCTKAEFTSSKIPPGKVIVMTLLFDTNFHNSSGQIIRRGVIIENNDPGNPQIEIWYQAKIRENR